VPYDVFEGRGVEDHLLLIPKRHLESLADFSDQEMLDMMHTVADHEKRGLQCVYEASQVLDQWSISLLICLRSRMKR
jgi:hypothetical protein